MSGPAVRSRLLALRRDREAARRGRDLLDQKREAIRRELAVRSRRLAELRPRVAAAIADARTLLAHAQVEVGRAAVDAAAIAQRVTAAVERRSRSVVGIVLPSLRGRFEAFHPCYSPAGTTEALDRAGEAFSAILPMLVDVAQETIAVQNLQRGLARTVRRLNALEKVVIPRLERDVHELAAALEEEERDESLRRKRWLGGRHAIAS